MTKLLCIFFWLQQAIQQGQPPLVNTTDYQGEENRNENSVGTSLEVAIDAVCQLVSVYELVTSAGNESELETVLRANLEDSCNWVCVINTSTDAAVVN